jgi:outer membrane protein assembly factor BamB
VGRRVETVRMRLHGTTIPVLAVTVVALLAGSGSGVAASHPSRSPAIVLAEHGTPGGSPGRAPGRAAATDWPSYHHDAAHTGAVAGLPAAGRLSIAWSRHLDGNVYGQPLIIGGIVIAATEHDTVYALSRSSGHVLWRAHVGTPVPLGSQPCGDIDPLGITGTPVYDGARHLVYVVAQTTGSRHVLVGIDIASGRVRIRRDIPAPDHQRLYDQQRAALALGNGRVYVAFGGHDGDCGPYVGSVVAIPASGSGPMRSYRVPAAREAGIWAAGGPVIGPDGTVYVSVGNGAATGPPYDGSDSVTALFPGLHRKGLFAPSSWPTDNASDLDLGSMSPALLSDGEILAVGKNGTGYLLRAAHLGGVGGQIAKRGICTAFGGAAVSAKTVYVPCVGSGMRAVSTAGNRIRVLWRGPAFAWGSPVVGGGAVWVADWNAGVLFELGRFHGQVRHRIALGSALPHFASPSLSGNLVIIGTNRGVVAVAGA